MKLGELIDLRKKKMVWKSTVAAGKQPRTELGVLGISIGQEKSSGDTSTVQGLSNIKEAIGFKLTGKEPENLGLQKLRDVKTIRVSELIRKIKLSSLSSEVVQAINSALSGYKKFDSLNLKDIDQLAVLANTDVTKLRDLAGF